MKLIRSRRKHGLHPQFPTGCDNKAASRLVAQGDDGRFALFIVMNGRSDWHDPEGSGSGLK